MANHWGHNGRPLLLQSLKQQEEEKILESVVRARTKKETQHSRCQNCGEAQGKSGELIVQTFLFPTTLQLKMKAGGKAAWGYGLQRNSSKAEKKEQGVVTQ